MGAPMDADDIRRLAGESAALQQRFFAENAERLLDVGERIAACALTGGRVLAFGNGGSAAHAQHLAAELVGRFRRERAALSAVSLAADSAVLSAVGNDMGFDAVFRRQIEAHGRAGDVAFGISTSGRSPNVVEGLRSARDRGLTTIALTGNGGGDLPALVEYLIDVPHRDTARIQEVHTVVVHVLCQIVEEAAGR
jgi:D-sedoheptulose 7-phosphate isomerase